MEAKIMKKEQTSEELRDAGIKQSVTHADEVVESWSEKAFKLMKEYVFYIQTGFIDHKDRQFMAENFRLFCRLSQLPNPPSDRAFGAIIVKSVKVGLIERVGYAQVRNKNAHCTPAAVWRVK